jgi:hypothetical protein
MLYITDAVGDFLEAVLDKARVPHNTAIRIRLEQGALAPALDTTRPGDETFDHHGRVVLVLDGQVREYLADSVLDVEQTADGPKLLILQ